ncbi:MAG: hypothetical protein JWM27_907, partial [Gemmatimonadetes bacterium]|nr:hypothetical protein [Gemmatimonadota bacterium]
LHRGVDACVAPSAAAVAEAVAFGIPAERVHLVPNGVDVDAFSPVDSAEKAALRARLGLGAGPVVLYLGRLSAEKDPVNLLDAWSAVAGAHPDAELVYVGEGPDEARLRARVEELRAPRVRLAGGSAEPAAWYRAADLFALPSRHEGLSNSLLEAAACGLPVVSTRVSGAVDLFARADLGELVPPRDPAALAGALERMLADPGRRAACGAAARNLIVRELAVDRVAAAVERVYLGA